MLILSMFYPLFLETELLVVTNGIIHLAHFNSCTENELKLH